VVQKEIKRWGWDRRQPSQPSNEAYELKLTGDTLQQVLFNWHPPQIPYIFMGYFVHKIEVLNERIVQVKFLCLQNISHSLCKTINQTTHKGRQVNERGHEYRLAHDIPCQRQVIEASLLGLSLGGAWPRSLEHRL